MNGGWGFGSSGASNSAFNWNSNTAAMSSAASHNDNNNQQFPTTTPTTQPVQSLDANDSKEEKSERDDMKTEPNPSLSRFAINHQYSSSPLQHTYYITSDGLIPACEATIHWNISKQAIDQSRANKATIKPNKKLTISPSGRAFIIYFEPEGTATRFGGNQGFNFGGGGNATRTHTTITVQEIPSKSSQPASVFANPSNGIYSVVVKVFDPSTSFGFGTQQTNGADIHNAAHWKVHQQTGLGLNSRSISITKRIQLFENSQLDSKIIDNLFRVQVTIRVPPTVITNVVRTPQNMAPVPYINRENDTKQGLLSGIATNANYNSSYEWYTNMCRMLESQTFGDIEIVCSDGKHWRAHKDILTNFSPVFKAMLGNPMQESLENNIELKEENSLIVKYLLLFMYTGSIPNDIDLDEVGGALLKAADKFGISGLTLLLFDFIKTRITPKNVAMALILCKLYKGSEFKDTVMKLNKYVLRYLAKLKNMRKVLRSKSFELLFTQHPDLVKTVLLTTNSINSASNKQNDDPLENDMLFFFDEEDSDEN